MRSWLWLTMGGWCVLALSPIACDSANNGAGGFGKSFTYGDGGGYQGTDSVVAAASVNTVSTSSVTAAVTAGTDGSSGNGCPDGGPGEPNDNMAQAYNLGEISDNDGDGSQLQGIMASATDVDWYKYHGVDLFGNVVDPTRQIMSPGVRVCKYVQCDGGEAPNFTCPRDTTADSQGGLIGCCWTTSSPETLGLTCGSSDLDSDNATIFIRVDNPQMLVCQQYTLVYHY